MASQTSTTQFTIHQLSDEAGKTIYMAKKTERLLKDCITKFCLHKLETDDDFLSKFFDAPDYKTDVMELYGKLLQYRLNGNVLQQDEWTDDSGLKWKPGAKSLVELMITCAKEITEEHNLKNNDTAAFLYFREISKPRLNDDITGLHDTNPNQY